MKTVRFLAGSYEWPWARQTPGRGGVFGDSKFVFGPDHECETDWLVVYDELPANWQRKFPKHRTIFVASEPTNVKRYEGNFLGQFGTVLTTDRQTPHANRIFGQVALPWHVGVEVGHLDRYHFSLDFEDFEQPFPEKNKLCSVICSDKAFTVQHRQRLEFVSRLTKALPGKVDVFGRGFRDMMDKDEALADYRFHIALENCAFDDYWTEKLADAFLRGCFPIYWGAPNIEDYFPASSLKSIDIRQPDLAIEHIANVIGSSVDQTASADLRESRRRVLWEYNVFSLVDRITEQILAVEQCRSRSDLSETQMVLLRPESSFLPVQSHPSLARRAVRRATRELSKGLSVRAKGMLAGKYRIGAQYLWDWAERLDPEQIAEPSKREKELQRWIADNGDHHLRLDYRIDKEDIVLDVGGFEGQWASDIVAKYGCHVHIFEPVPKYADLIARRFARNELVHLHVAALGAAGGEMLIGVEGDGSSQFVISSKQIRVPVIGISQFLEEQRLSEVALLKLNIEGSEYALLEALLQSGLIARIRDLQVQFHDFVPNAADRRRGIRDQLESTHEPIYSYEFVWESWRRKTKE